MISDSRKIIVSSIIAVLALSILTIVIPAYSEHPTEEKDKDKKRADEEAKAKAKQHEEEAKAEKMKTKEKGDEQEQEQQQQKTSSVNGTATTDANHSAESSSFADQLHRGSTFSLGGSGEANKRDTGDTAKVSAELSLSVFRVTPHMVLVKVTGGSVTIGDTTHEVERGKAVIAMKAHKMILTAQVSDEHGKKTLKLMGNAANPMSDSTEDVTANTHTMELEGKLAQWFIKMKAEITKSG